MTGEFHSAFYHKVAEATKHLQERPCFNTANYWLVRSAARRLFAKQLSNDDAALAYIQDRMRVDPDMSTGSEPLESDVVTIMQDLIRSEAFEYFLTAQRKMHSAPDEYDARFSKVYHFIRHQCLIYGLEGRRSFSLEHVFTHLLVQFEIGGMKDLSEESVRRALRSGYITEDVRSDL